MAKDKTTDKRLKNELDICLRVIKHFYAIKNNTGFGKIELDVKDGYVVYTGYSVRDHLT